MTLITKYAILLKFFLNMKSHTRMDTHMDTSDAIDISRCIKHLCERWRSKYFQFQRYPHTYRLNTVLQVLLETL